MQKDDAVSGGQSDDHIAVGLDHMLLDRAEAGEIVAGEMNDIMAGRGAAREILDRVVPETACEVKRVGAGIAGEDVVTRAARDLVVVAAAADCVIPASAEKRIGASAAGESVVAISTQHSVATCAAYSAKFERSIRRIERVRSPGEYDTTEYRTLHSTAYRCCPWRLHRGWCRY